RPPKFYTRSCNLLSPSAEARTLPETYGLTLPSLDRKFRPHPLSESPDRLPQSHSAVPASAELCCRKTHFPMCNPATMTESRKSPGRNSYTCHFRKNTAGSRLHCIPDPPDLWNPTRSSTPSST